MRRRYNRLNKIEIICPVCGKELDYMYDTQIVFNNLVCKKHIPALEEILYKNSNKTKEKILEQSLKKIYMRNIIINLFLVGLFFEILRYLPDIIKYFIK